MNKSPQNFILAAGSNDKDLVNEDFKFFNLESNCTSFENLKISETLPIIKNCDLYLGNDTGWLHIACCLRYKMFGIIYG